MRVSKSRCTRLGELGAELHGFGRVSWVVLESGPGLGVALLLEVGVRPHPGRDGALRLTALECGLVFLLLLVVEVGLDSNFIQ